MRLLIKRAVIIDPASKYHGKKVDVFIKNGKIEGIGRDLKVTSDRTISSKDLHISPGWCDLGTQVGEPGFEHREDLRSVAQAALRGGYSAIASFPNTDPVVDSKAEVEYVLNRSHQLPIQIHPIGAVTHGAKGDYISEMHDMHNSGAVAFSDGRHPIAHSGVTLIALQYVMTFGGLIINRPYDANIGRDGQMNEGNVSTTLGLKGIPTIAERIPIDRDIQLLRYTGSRLHEYCISTAESVRLVKAAQRSGLNLSASVAALNLHFTDEALKDFNTNLKIMPPLRPNSDRRALIRGISDGTISAIVANHEPLEDELKKLEFGYSEFGASGLETAFAVANSALQSHVDIKTIAQCFFKGPREILNLEVPTITKGEFADVTLFDPSAEWSVSSSDLVSRSGNNPMVGRTLTGRVLGVVSKQLVHLNEMP